MKTCKSFKSDGKGNNGYTMSREEHLDKLLRQHEKQAHQFAYKLARNQEEAAELVQQASYRALRHRGEYDPVKSFKNWYLTIVRNLFFDSIKRSALRHMASLDAESEDAPGYSLVEILADGEPEPLEQIQRHQNTHTVRQSLRALSASLRDVLTICDMEGLRYKDAAQRLGLPLGTVRSRLFRARATLRRDPRIRRLA